MNLMKCLENMTFKKKKNTKIKKNKTQMFYPREEKSQDWDMKFFKHTKS